MKEALTVIVRTLCTCNGSTVMFKLISIITFTGYETFSANLCCTVGYPFKLSSARFLIKTVLALMVTARLGVIKHHISFSSLLNTCKVLETWTQECLRIRLEI